MKYRNQLLFAIIDAALSLVSIFSAVWLRFEGLIPLEYQTRLPAYYIIAAVTIIAGGAFCGTYQSVLQYLGFADAFRQIVACLSSAVVFLIIKYTGIYPASGSITIIYFGILLILTTGVRLIPRFRHWFSIRRQGRARPTLIIGAGSTGVMIIKRLAESAEEGLNPIVAVDDDPEKLHMRVSGVYVAARLNQISQVIRKYKIEEAILAIPGLEADKVRDIHQKCAASGIKLRLFRSVVDMESFFAGDQRALRQIDIEDLLFRDSVRLDKQLIFQCLEGKTVLVTGGAGSIGSEICRQALANGCGKLIIYDISENGLFEINESLKRVYLPQRYELCLGSTYDAPEVDRIFGLYKPHIVFHAAARKHVPMVEINVFEAVKINIIGTQNIIQACLRHDVERFIMISTDKAVNPSSLMGATKRVAELLTQSAAAGTAANAATDTREGAVEIATVGALRCKMAAVRFGNVLVSSGSVIPTFRKQIEAGGPVTVTHQDMERYFMTIPEAVSLVLVAGTLAEGGEIFVLDMGDPVRIYDLARELIRLSGYVPDKDIKIEFTGIRPGEKIAEQLALDSENFQNTAQEKLFVMKSEGFDHVDFADRLNQIKQAVETRDEAGLRAILMDTVARFS